jgi:Flp pilus assembly protein TadG
MIEFSFVVFTLMIVILAGIEFARMVLIYTTVADCARAGVRYAIVNGSLAGAPNPPSDNPSNVITVVQNFASAGALTPANLNVTVTYPDSSSTPRSRVKVAVRYQYDPMTILPLGVPITSIAEGRITF